MLGGDADHPNIVFIMSDDHAAHAIGAYGSRVNHTRRKDSSSTSHSLALPRRVRAGILSAMRERRERRSVENRRHRVGVNKAAQGASSRPGKQRVGGPIRSGNLVFVGGIGGWYPERRPEGPGDARQQFGDALEMMKESLEKAGTSMANALRIKVSLVDPATNWGAVNEVFQERFPEPRPVCSCFGATGFRRGPGQLLQVECIAYID
jgi:2-iminobutanoate/2-iminopropanoate deaminase